MAKLILVKENGEEIVVKTDVSENTIPSDVIIRNQFLAVKAWSREDVSKCLEEKGYNSSDKNIDAVVNTGSLQHLEDCTDDEWEVIFNAIDSVSSVLESN